MAIEDAASIGQLLPEATPAVDIPDRLQLYERVRHERAAKGGFDMLLYCHDFDEWQNSAEKLEEHLRAKAGTNGS